MSKKPTKPKSKPETQDLREQIGVKLPRSLINRLDAYCAAQPAAPSRTAVIEAAIERFLSHHKM